MTTASDQRRAGTLMFTDMAGFSQLTHRDEALSLALLAEHKRLVEGLVREHGGRVRKGTGDGYLVEFPPGDAAIACASAIQTAIYERNVGLARERRFHVRIGVHAGPYVERDGDIYGDTVNTAARLESGCPVGGVLLSAAALGERDGVHQVERLGPRTFKGIETPIEVLRLVLPFEEELGFGGRILSWLRRQVRRIALTFESLRTWALALPAALALVTAALGLLAGAQVQKPTWRTGSEGRPAIPLAGPWDYATGAEGWKPLPEEREARLVLAERLHGDFRLRTSFAVAAEDLPQSLWKAPALTLGSGLRGRLRLHVNGQLVGADLQRVPARLHAFSPSLLQAGANEVVVEVRGAPRSFEPALSAGLDLPPLVGEADVLEDRIAAHNAAIVDRRAYLWPAALVVALVFAAGVLQGRNGPLYAWFSAYLMLASAWLFAHAPLAQNGVEPTLLAFLQLFSALAQPLALIGALTHLVEARRLATLHSACTTALLVFAAALFWTAPSLVVADGQRIVLAQLAAAYAALWLPWGIVRGVRKGRSGQARAHAVLLLAFVALGILTLLGDAAVRHLADSATARGRLVQAQISAPFLFAMLVLAIGVAAAVARADYLRRVRRRDELLVRISSILTSDLEQQVVIGRIHEALCEHLQAERSTIYLYRASPQPVLRSIAYFGPELRRLHVAETTVPEGGVIGHVVRHRVPILVRDLERDARFRAWFRARPRIDSYRTRSCMVTPLVAQSRLVGVLTVADPRGARVYGDDDFAMLKMIGTDLALLVSALGEPPSAAQDRWRAGA